MSTALTIVITYYHPTYPAVLNNGLPPPPQPENLLTHRPGIIIAVDSQVSHKKYSLHPSGVNCPLTHVG